MPATTPGAPTVGTATAGNGSATVTWTAPAGNGGLAVTGYTVTAGPGGQTATVNGTATSAVVAGLTNGTSYTFTVHATNAVGNSPESSSTTAVVPMTVPGVPTGVTATRGNGSATVTWTAPAANGGSPVTGYTVSSPEGGPTVSVTVNGSTLSATVTGLANGSSYTFTVHATNAVGNSAESGPSAAVTPATTPGTPTGVIATRGDGAATVSWTAPSTDGGSVITRYTVTASPGGLHATATTGSSAVVTGLTNGTAYTFTVHATNAVGDGPESAPSAAVTPATTPGVPTIGTAVAGNGTAAVSWTAPTSNGGSSVTGYTVTSHPGSVTATVGAGATSATITWA